MDGYEERIANTKFEVKAEGEDEKRKIIGHATLFDDPAPENWGFIEKIAPGAFTDALLTSDVRALKNHNPDWVLGRKKSGTLKLEEDKKGLLYEIDPPGTTYADDLIISMDRGDIDQSSFQFKVEIEEWDESGDIPVRTIIKVSELRDVSVVTFPWYPNTDADVRSKKEIFNKHLESKGASQEIIEKRKRALKKVKYNTMKVEV